MLFLQLKMHPAHLFSKTKNVLIFSSNTCTAHFTAKIKRPFLTFILTENTIFSFFYPLPPLLEVNPGQKFQVLEFTNGLFNHSFHHKQSCISSDDLFLCNCFKCQFSNDCILQYAMFYKKHSILQK